jgi:pimeloyl-ACP methyl ester carboxylesterase
MTITREKFGMASIQAWQSVVNHEPPLPVNGKTPIDFLTDEYDYACSPEMSEDAARQVGNAHYTTMMGIGHFAMAGNPDLFKRYLLPALTQINEAVKI